MIRVVIDTNIFISALLQPNGPPAQILVLALASENVRLCISADVYAEYEEVIRRPKFKRSENEITDVLRAIREQGLWVKPSQKVRACSDPDDDILLECAQASHAHFLVTGNLKHFPPSWGRYEDRDRPSVSGYLNPYFNLLAEEERAPRLEAQKEFATGLELFYSNPTAAIVHVKRAAEIDHDFFWPRYLLAYSINNSGKIAEAVAQLDAVEKTQNLTALQRSRVAWLRANIGGRSEEVYSIARDIVRRVPEEHINSIDVAVGGSWSNRPRDAVENFKTLRGPPFFTPSNTFGLYFLQQWTDALHLLGEHEEELQEARWGKGLYPHLLNAYAYEVRALVALGRLEEADRLIDEILAMPSTWSYTSCCLPHGTPGYVMLNAAEELRTHDHRDAALRMADRAVDWYRSRVGGEAKDEDTRSNLGEGLYRAERWQEAEAVFRALSAEHPGNIFYQGRLGTLAARRGERARALQIAEKLRRNETPYLYGNHTFRSARITALLGEKERAVALLRDAVAQGSGTEEESDSYGYGFIYPHSMDLESLHGYPPFEELIKPKD